MQLTNILTAAVPLLALATALPSQGEWPGAGAGVGTGGAGKPDAAASGAPSKSFNKDFAGGANFDGPPQDGNGIGADPSNYNRNHPRSIVPRAKAATDYHVRECKGHSYGGECKTFVAIPEGKHDSGCINRLFHENQGSIHLVEPTLMCTYFQKANCDRSGDVAGPWTAEQIDYDEIVFYQKKFPINDPRSYFCEPVTFSNGPAYYKPGPPELDTFDG